MFRERVAQANSVNRRVIDTHTYCRNDDSLQNNIPLQNNFPFGINKVLSYLVLYIKKFLIVGKTLQIYNF